MAHDLLTELVYGGECPPFIVCREVTGSKPQVMGVITAGTACKLLVKDYIEHAWLSSCGDHHHHNASLNQVKATPNLT